MNSVLEVISLVGESLGAIWGYNIVTVSGHHIRISNVAMAFILFTVGFKYSKNITGLVKTYVKSKLQDDKDAANAIEKLILCLLFSLFIIIILEIANVPLSAFAFIGGALAIGIGLGAQNTISNFLSSLIIMVERPMKIGDIVEIEGVTGIVTSVGARCIVVTNFANVEVLIPNNKIMQDTLINWTLSDNLVKFRAEISIPKKKGGGSYYRKFMQELEMLAKDFDFLVKNTCPAVFLTEIGEDSYTFSLVLDCNITQIQNTDHVKNELNLSLLNTFKQYDFKIYFPKLVDVTPIVKSEK